MLGVAIDYAQREAIVAPREPGNRSGPDPNRISDALIGQVFKPMPQAACATTCVC